jgi:lipopolysaccharide/colanic/teichoic acid biosynthesis glycosyltransferase
MDRHLLDRLIAGIAFVFLIPVFVVAAVGIRLSSPGPIFFRAQRVGQRGSKFRLIKFRTMRLDQGPTPSVITAAGDSRIFPFGKWLREWKLDELPQLFNVLRGEMALVGPRPEDPGIVSAHYHGPAFETLLVRPGLASPGSLYNYTHGERMLHDGDAERRYVDELLPTKLALDLVYIRRASVRYDATIIWRTLSVLTAAALGREAFPDPPELTEARQAALPTACTRNPVVGRDDDRGRHLAQGALRVQSPDAT